MKRDLNRALDECVARLQAGGATLEECMARYPEYADDLRPLLRIALEIRRIPRPASSPAGFAAGRQKMLDALAEKQRRQVVSTSPFPRRVKRSVASFGDLLARSGGAAAWKRPLSHPIALATGLALILFVIGYFCLLPRPDATFTQEATLIPLDGVVEIMPASTPAWRPAFDGERVQVGDQVRTGPLSAATLIFFDGSATELQDGAEVAIIQMSAQPEDERVIVLRQTAGQTRSSVRRESSGTSRFQIRTPTAVASVRGTEFSVAVEANGTTHVTVVKGLVEVTAQKTIVAVQAGQVTTVRPKRPPSPPAAMPHTTPTPTTDEPLIAKTSPASSPTIAPAPFCKPQSSEEAEAPPPPGQTKTPQPPGQTKTPQPPGRTRTPQPPGQTRTPQPPGRTKTPQPPGQDKPPPGKIKPPKPPKKP